MRSLLLVVIGLGGCATAGEDPPDPGTTRDASEAREAGPRQPGCPETAMCGERACGQDPICNVSCGDCGAREACEDGRCVCVPDCAGRPCGPDGCGGTCDECPADQACADGACSERPTFCPEDADCAGRDCGLDPVCGVSCGECDGDCVDGVCECTPDCGDRACGDDGCGGECGGCEAGTVCRDGACAAVPAECPEIADCGDQTCGTDPVCGILCGDCAAGQICSRDQCVDPDRCFGRTCGPDGNGGMCGVCDAGFDCEQGVCVCVPQCADAACGDDGCGGSCGDCAASELCMDGACVCQPDCAGRQCGDNGCGGVCGGCPAGVACAAGACACDPHWSRAIANALVTQVAEQGGFVLVAGRLMNDDAHVWVFDTCGEPVNDAPINHPMANGSQLSFVTPIEGDVLVGGSLQVDVANVGPGFIARLTVPDLRVVWSQTIATGLGRTSLVDAAVDAQGEIWISGSNGIFPNATASVVQANQNASCNWVPPPLMAAGSNSTYDVAIDADGSTAYLSGAAGNRPQIVAYPTACQVPACGCGQPTTFMLPERPGQSFVAALGLEVDDGTLYTSSYGFGGMPEVPARIHRVPLDGGPIASVDWNPTPQLDFIYDVALTPNGVLAAGSRGFAVMGGQLPDGAIVQFDRALRQIDVHNAGPGYVVDLFTGADAVYALRNDQPTITLLRCPLTGACLAE